jgi:hypothetical protein
VRTGRAQHARGGRDAFLRKCCPTFKNVATFCKMLKKKVARTNIFLKMLKHFCEKC